MERLVVECEKTFYQKEGLDFQETLNQPQKPGPPRIEAFV